MENDGTIVSPWVRRAQAGTLPAVDTTVYTAQSTARAITASRDEYGVPVSEPAISWLERRTRPLSTEERMLIHDERWARSLPPLS